MSDRFMVASFRFRKPERCRDHTVKLCSRSGRYRVRVRTASGSDRIICVIWKRTAASSRRLIYVVRDPVANARGSDTESTAPRIMRGVAKFFFDAQELIVFRN